MLLKAESQHSSESCKSAIANVDKLTSEIEIVKSKLSNTNEELKKHSEFIPIYQEIDKLNIEINLFEAKLNEHSQDRVEESKVAWKVLMGKSRSNV